MFGGLRVRLVEDWQHAYRWSSMRFLAIGAAIQTALLTTPTTVLQYVPQWALSTLATISLASVVMAGVGRITTTEKPHEPDIDHH